MSEHGGKLAGKVALITGGSSGIGLATAKRLLAEGADVFVTGRREEALEAAVRSLGAAATGIRGDVSRLADLDSIFRTIREQKGRLDILFANAGGGTLAPLESITEEHFDRIFAANVRGLLFTVQKALPLMQEGASIVLNASIASVKALNSLSVYCASKAAVRSFARTWSLELKGRGIRINAVSPGVVPTPGYDLLGLSPDQIKQFIAGQVANIPLGREGTPDEVARAVVFLASSDSSFVNGIELFVDGGMAQI